MLDYYLIEFYSRKVLYKAGTGDWVMCILRLREHSLYNRNEQRCKTSLGTYTLFTFFYHDLIYIHTTNIFILISFFKDGGDAGSSPTKRPHTSTSRGNGGIFAWAGHISRRRISFHHLMPARNDLQIVGEIVYIYICVCMVVQEILWYMIGSTRNSIVYA